MKNVLLGLVVMLAIAARAQNAVGTALRAQLNLNGTWQYVINQPQTPIPASGWQPMRAPSAPWTDGTTSVWYKQSTFVPSAWAQTGRRFFLELEKCGHYCAIYVNGQFAGDHYGQFTPYEAEVTSGIVGGENNEFEIYAHMADSNYTRRGAVINQSSCPSSNTNCMANSYRPAAFQAIPRNWVGMVGDVTFSWRPQEYVSVAQIKPSVRNWTLTVNLTVVGASPAATIGASVLDAGVDVLDIPAQPVVNGAASLVASWSTPTLWQIGKSKLYTLRVTLIENSATVDTRYDRFGFREVWVSGTKLLLNGQALWLSGDYLPAFSGLRWANDRRPEAMQLHIQQAAGVVTMHYHWDDAGREWLELADEMGIPVIAIFYCTGPGKNQAQVDSPQAWTDWMAATAAEWATAERNHPSIMLWRPVDIYPTGAGSKQQVDPVLGASVRGVCPYCLLATSSSDADVDSWGQASWSKQNPQICDDGADYASWLAAETKPSIIREIWGFTLPCSQSFLQQIYQVSYQGGSSGFVVQQLELWSPSEFAPQWFSMSGIGNRPSSGDGLPDWMTRKWNESVWGAAFDNLYTTWVGATPDGSPQDGEYEATQLPVTAGTAFLVPPSGSGIPIGVLPFADGTAWFVTPVAGNNTLEYSGPNGDVQVSVVANPPAPF